MLYKVGDLVKHFESKNLYGLVTQTEKTSPKSQFCTIFCFYDGDIYSISNAALEPIEAKHDKKKA